MTAWLYRILDNERITTIVFVTCLALAAVLVALSLTVAVLVVT